MVPEQPQPSAAVAPPRMQLFPYRWGYLASTYQVMEGMWLEGRSKAEVSEATNTWAPWGRSR